MTPRLLMRIAMLARHPPGRRQIIVMIVVLGAVAALAVLEWALGGWPAWLTPQRTGL